MARSDTLELLEATLEGRRLTPQELDEFLSKRPREDLHLDYKHGDLLVADKEAAKTLRTYAAGFANAAGGILMVGVADDLTITGCRGPGGKDLAEWASDCVKPLAPFLSSPPRFYEIKHESESVLVVATARSARLVPCTEAGRLVYYFRIHDKTISAPDYLVADLVLGRREQPDLIPKVTGVSISKRDEYQVTIAFQLVVMNEGFVYAELVRVGMVTWAVGEGESAHSRSLLSHVDPRHPKKWTNCHLLHYHSTKYKHQEHDVAPFAAQPFSEYGNFAVPYEWHGYTVHMALYVMAKGAAPAWFQLTVPLRRLDAEIRREERATGVTVEPLQGERAVVEWEGH